MLRWTLWLRTVAETTGPTTGHIIRTVVHTNYAHDEGVILNGNDWTDQDTIHSVASITVSGNPQGSLRDGVTVNKLTGTTTPTAANSQIQSNFDGDPQGLLASIG